MCSAGLEGNTYYPNNYHQKGRHDDHTISVVVDGGSWGKKRVCREEKWIERRWLKSMREPTHSLVGSLSGGRPDICKN